MDQSSLEIAEIELTKINELLLQLDVVSFRKIENRNAMFSALTEMKEMLTVGAFNRKSLENMAVNILIYENTIRFLIKKAIEGN